MGKLDSTVLNANHQAFAALVGSDDVAANIIEWLTMYYISPKSDRSRTYKPDVCPWFIQPLKDVASGLYRIVSIMGSTGAGKSELICQFLTWAISNKAGDTLLLQATDEDVKDFMESRFLNVIRAMLVLTPILPKNADSIRKGALILPHMSLYASGANLTSVQGKSCRYVICDESWEYGQGIVTEALARLHSRRDGVALIVGQAGIENDEHYFLHEKTNKHEWSWLCPDCGGVHPYRFKQLAYTIARTRENDLDRLAIAESVRLKCPNPKCQALFHEDDRHRLVGTYSKVSSNALPENIGYKVSAIGLPHVKWSSLAIQHEEAKDRMRVGDVSEMRAFKQKVECIPWKERLVDTTKIRTSGYKMVDYIDGRTPAFPSNNGREGRLMAIDFQLKFRYAIVREYDRNTWVSKLLTAVELESDDEIEEIRQHYGVLPVCTFCDCGYDTHRIGLLSRKYGYRLLRGSGQEFWTITAPDVDPIKSYLSEMQTMEIQGLHIEFKYFASCHFRDILQEKIENDPDFGIPDDAPAKYRRDLSSETREIKFSQAGAPRPKWVLAPHQTNDFADTETLLLAALGEAKLI